MKEAVHKEFFDEAIHSYVLNEQTCLAFPLPIGLPPEPLRSTVRDNLEHNIWTVHKGHITSGVLRACLQLKYLTRAGRGNLIHTMVSQRDYPGWGHMIEKGDTTISEGWGGSGGGGSGSGTHTSFLSAGSWFVDGLAGIQPDEEAPGFKRIVITPTVVASLTWVKRAHEAVRGKIVSKWRREGGKVRLDVTIPPNTTATVHVPTTQPAPVTESGRATEEVDGMTFLRTEGNAAVYRIGSGRYTFEAI